jgi:uncharacterized protein (DUF1697 family)
MDSIVSNTGRYVALLRGINVGVAKRISMADLRAVFESLGYSGARTLLQSGNVVFEAPGTAGVSASRLENAIAETTGVRASTLVLTAERFASVLADNPFADCADPSRMIITFCDTAPEASRATKANVSRPTDKDLEPEKIVIGADAIYQWLPDGVLETKLPARYTERFATVSTARNLRTAGKILALLNT